MLVKALSNSEAATPFTALALGLCASFYALAWDVFKDFGLGGGGLSRLCRKVQLTPDGEKRGDRHWFLRDRSVFHPRLYCAVVAADACLRLVWLLPALRGPSSARGLEAAAWGFGAAEVFRRTIWNVASPRGEKTGRSCFVNSNVDEMFRSTPRCASRRVGPAQVIRVENEHATNCGRFRATRSVPLDVVADAGGASDKGTRLAAPSFCAVVARACCPSVAALVPEELASSKALLVEDDVNEDLELRPAVAGVPELRRRAMT